MNGVKNGWLNAMYDKWRAASITSWYTILNPTTSCVAETFKSQSDIDIDLLKSDIDIDLLKSDIDIDLLIKNVAIDIDLLIKSVAIDIDLLIKNGLRQDTMKCVGAFAIIPTASQQPLFSSFFSSPSMQ